MPSKHNSACPSWCSLAPGVSHVRDVKSRPYRPKCDYTHPHCTRCLKAGRICTWDSSLFTCTDQPNGTDAGSLAFKSENAFARGLARRPRKSKSKSTAIISALAPATPSRALSTPLTLHAFQYWVRGFTSQPDDSRLPDIAHDYNTYALCHWNQASAGSSPLYLAVSAFSLAVFGRARGESRALGDAAGFYAKSVAATQRELRRLAMTGTGTGPDIEADVLIDQLVVATMVMGSYEFTVQEKQRHSQSLSFSVVHHHHRDAPVTDEVGSRFWKDVCHYQGTLGLMQIRQQKQQQKGYGCTQNMALDRAARRPIIRACILRGTAIPEWLQDGALFGEQGPALGLDSLMVRVAALRSKTLWLFRHDIKGLAQVSWLESGEDVEKEANELESALESWPGEAVAAASQGDEWRFSSRVQMHSDGCAESSVALDDYQGIVHTYATHGHAAAWSRWRAISMIVSSIRLRLLRAQDDNEYEGLELFASYRPQAETMICARIQSLAIDMCRSVPFFFNGGSSSRPHLADDPEVLPRIAALLGWSLTVAVSTEAVPNAPKEWLRHQLVRVARALGDAVIESAAEREEFRF
ncbi:hypothetical protein B0T17DRAFT_351540 [Bombardia bombarda]|uniref:Zn(2)-C6 fungal-type domain-containing protein n=1 Tax=Bombardia bombarda TaxID=252184 RepID=A0AA40BW11_9PEZI|nr:hypothetical protein B0T17DRAFT_351540 [Bombardia bombarda]